MKREAWIVDRFPIIRDGYPFILAAVVLTVIGWWVHRIIGVGFLALLFFVIYFFRNPRRVIPQGEGLILSPADGKIVFCGKQDQNHKVSIFMSPLNVHINRIPVTGTIKDIAYNKGKFWGAFHDKASLDNEQNVLVIETHRGDEIKFVQIAGMLARRIVCYARPGELWNQGDIFGLIRFGSRMDIYFPLRYDVKVTVGQKVKGGETILAS